MLTDTKARNAKAADKPYKLADSGGLHLYVTPAGSRIWRARYKFDGKENVLTIGHYPEVSLAQARAARDEAATVRRSGRDPSAVRKGTKAAVVVAAANTFEVMARAWHAQHVVRWKEQHAFDVLRSLERDVFPTLGNVPIHEIDAPMVLKALRVVEQRPAVETAHRIRQRMSDVFVFGIANGVCANDPAAIVRKALAPVVRGHQPAITNLVGLREVMRRAEAITAFPGTKLALRLLALTAVRSADLRGVEVAEFEGDEVAALGGNLWRIPPERIKKAREHLVPLSRQALEVIEEARKLVGRGKLLFPSTRHTHRPMSENAIGYLLNRAGYHGKHVPHGFRAAFSTIMNEKYRADRAIIDLMLSHSPDDKVEAAYNRALHMERRRELAQDWADMLMEGMPPVADLLIGPRR